MKLLKYKLKSFAAFLAIIILSQGCTVYKGSITLEEAVAGRQKVKVTTTDSPKPMEFRRIELINGKYKGLPKRYSQSDEVVIKKENITRIKEHDKTGSNLLTFSPLVLIVGLGILLFSNGGEDFE
ncbi:MAG: hypothetical protein JKY22_01725 [Flavobacteriaceae bacterium]|nr:hypothetical protein [Flavobacteriaceae bacterium]